MYVLGQVKTGVIRNWGFMFFYQHGFFGDIAYHRLQTAIVIEALSVARLGVLYRSKTYSTVALLTTKLLITRKQGHSSLTKRNGKRAGERKC